MTTKMPHQFTLILADTALVDEALENRVFEAGCGDALLAVCDGVVSLDFGRCAATLKEALTSAIHDVEAAGFTVASRAT